MTMDYTKTSNGIAVVNRRELLGPPYDNMEGFNWDTPYYFERIIYKGKPLVIITNLEMDEMPEPSFSLEDTPRTFFDVYNRSESWFKKHFIVKGEQPATDGAIEGLSGKKAKAKKGKAKKKAAPKPKKIKKVKAAPEPKVKKAKSKKLPQAVRLDKKWLQITLKQAKALAVFAAKEKMRYALNGIFIKSSKKGLCLVLTDGKRLVAYDMALKGLPVFELIAPTEDFLDLVRRTKGAIEISALRALPQIEGQFPDYQDIIPKDVPTLVMKYSHELDAICGYIPIGVNPSYVRDIGAVFYELHGIEITEFYGRGDVHCPLTAIDKTPGAKLVGIVMPINVVQPTAAAAENE